MIRFYKISFKNETNLQINFIPDLILSTNSLDYDTFKVNSIQLIPDTSLIVVGIEDYGILIYCVVQKKVVKLISVIKYAKYSSFKINSIVAENKNSLYLVFERIGVMNVYLNDTLFK